MSIVSLIIAPHIAVDRAETAHKQEIKNEITVKQNKAEVVFVTQNHK